MRRLFQCSSAPYKIALPVFSAAAAALLNAPMVVLPIIGETSFMGNGKFDAYLVYGFFGAVAIAAICGASRLALAFSGAATGVVVSKLLGLWVMLQSAWARIAKMSNSATAETIQQALDEAALAWGAPVLLASCLLICFTSYSFCKIQISLKQLPGPGSPDILKS